MDPVLRLEKLKIESPVKLRANFMLFEALQDVGDGQVIGPLIDVGEPLDSGLSVLVGDRQSDVLDLMAPGAEGRQMR